MNKLQLNTSLNMFFLIICLALGLGTSAVCCAAPSSTAVAASAVINKKASTATLKSMTGDTTLSFAQAIQKLTALLDPLKTYQANFHQQTLGVTPPMPPSEGKVSIVRPGQFYWEVITPIHQKIIVNGSQVWIYDVDLAQVTHMILSPKDAHMITPAQLLTQPAAELVKQFNLQAQQPAKQQLVFILSPKVPNDLFKSVTLYFSGPELTQMQIVNSLGQDTKYQFSAIKMNAPIDSHLFNFIPPKGVEVLNSSSL